MLYLLLLILAIFFNSIMDADTLDVFGQLSEKRYKSNPTKFNKILWEWVDADSWENKYQVRDWLISKHVPKSIATWLAKDVLVIFLDLWHFAKALMMVCFEIPIAILTIQMVPFLPLWLWMLILFMSGGVIFNLFYYRFRKLV